MEDLVQKIISATKLSPEEIDRKIVGKQRELSNLVSREGAAYIVAKELGIDVMKKARPKLDVHGLMTGIRDLTIQVRVLKVFDVREFEKNGRKGKVVNIIIADQSGSCRLSLWDDQTVLLENLKPGAAVEIFGAYTKDDGRGGIEVRLGKIGGIKLLEQSDIPVIENLQKSLKSGRVEISELKEGATAELRAAIVQIFETEQWYEVCGQCGTRLKQEKINIQPGIEAFAWKCVTHGTIPPVHTLVVSGVADDGTGSIRVVFFRDLAAKILGSTIEDLIARKGKIFETSDILGKEFILQGRARRNQMFDRLEFIVSEVNDVNPTKETELILNLFASNGKTVAAGV